MSLCKDLRAKGVVIWAEAGYVKARGADVATVQFIRENKALVLDELGLEAEQTSEVIATIRQARQVASALAKAKPQVQGNCLALLDIFDSILELGNDFGEFYYAIERNRSRVMGLIAEIRHDEQAAVYEGKELVKLARRVLLANTTFRITEEALA